MYVNFNNKGVLIPIFLAASIIGVFALNALLKEYIFDFEYDFQIVLGLALLISGLWTFVKSDDYIEVHGKKEKVYFNNTFYFIPMKIWGKIELVAGVLITLGGILETINK